MRRFRKILIRRDNSKISMSKRETKMIRIMENILLKLIVFVIVVSSQQKISQDRHKN